MMSGYENQIDEGVLDAFKDMLSSIKKFIANKRSNPAEWNTFIKQLEGYINQESIKKYAKDRKKLTSEIIYIKSEVSARDFVAAQARVKKLYDMLDKMKPMKAYESYRVHYPSLKKLASLEYTDPRVNTEGKKIHIEKEGTFKSGDNIVSGHYVVYEDEGMPGSYIGVHIGNDINEESGEAPVSVVAIDTSRRAVMNRVAYRARQSAVEEASIASKELSLTKRVLTVGNIGSVDGQVRGVRESVEKPLSEATRSKYEIFHDSFTSAVAEAKEYAEKNGYEIVENDWFNYITVGRGRPKDGQTFATHIGLEKDGKVQRKSLHIQVYNRETHYRTYELNCYIS